MIHWSWLLCAAIWGIVLGERRGWKRGMELVYGWRLQSRQWRYAYERSAAKSEAEMNLATEEYERDVAEIQTDKEEARGVVRRIVERVVGYFVKRQSAREEESR